MSLTSSSPSPRAKLRLSSPGASSPPRSKRWSILSPAPAGICSVMTKAVGKLSGRFSLFFFRLSVSGLSESFELYLGVWFMSCIIELGCRQFAWLIDDCRPYVLTSRCFPLSLKRKKQFFWLNFSVEQMHTLQSQWIGGRDHHRWIGGSSGQFTEGQGHDVPKGTIFANGFVLSMHRGELNRSICLLNLTISFQFGTWLQGGWETDESMEEAALRETIEEAGVRGDVEVSNYRTSILGLVLCNAGVIGQDWLVEFCNFCREIWVNGDTRARARGHTMMATCSLYLSRSSSTVGPRKASDGEDGYVSLCVFGQCFGSLPERVRKCIELHYMLKKELLSLFFRVFYRFLHPRRKICASKGGWRKR